MVGRIQSLHRDYRSIVARMEPAWGSSACAKPIGASYGVWTHVNSGGGGVGGLSGAGIQTARMRAWMLVPMCLHELCFRWRGWLAVVVAVMGRR